MDREATFGTAGLDWRTLPAGTPEHAEFCARRRDVLAAWAILVASGVELDDLFEEIDALANAMRIEVRCRMATR